RRRDRPGPGRADQFGPVERIRAGLARRQFAGRRRLGPVVAVLGPDGAGKGSVIAGLQSSIPVAVTALYLGRRGARARSAIGAREPAQPGEAQRSRAGRAREAAFVLRN